MRIKPLHDKVLVKQANAERRTKSGIIIPEISKYKPQEGEVVSIGTEDMEVAKGDRVVFNKYAGTEVKINDEEFLLLSHDEILCVLE